jgi:transcription antitermination factor NusG
MSYWAVVQTAPQHEHTVRLLLMRGQYETYLPRILVRQRITPLFPTYLFVSLAEKRWYPILWTPHVTRLLMSGDQPTKLPENVVNQIRKRERNGLVKLPLHQLRKGQQVRIIRGSFEGQIGLYDGMSGKDRERVLLELLGQAVAVELPGKDIAPLNLASARDLRY